MNDLVSIIMPSYNSDKYIIDSINSIIAQTYVTWELIVVDDCSNDNTVAIIKSYADSRIRLFINNSNSGAAISRNRALRKAEGKWIAFLDSDDMWLPEKLERQLVFMEKNNYNFTYTDYRINYNGVWLPYIYTGPNVVTKRTLYNYCYFSTITVIYNRNMIGLIQIENLKKNNDYAMWFQAIEKSPCYRFPECLSVYVKHDDSISSGPKFKLIRYHYIMFRKGLSKSVFLAVLFTVNNLVHGVLKKIKYKIPVDLNQKNVY